MVKIGDEVVLTKEIGCFEHVNEIGRVDDIINDNIVSIVYDDFAQLYISMSEFDKYFEKYEEEEIFTLNEEYIDEIIANSQITSSKVFDKCIVVACKLPNGFVIVESSACVDPRNYDEKIGFDICMKRIKDKVWELEAYNLQEDIYLNERCEEDSDEDKND